MKLLATGLATLDKDVSEFHWYTLWNTSVYNVDSNLSLRSKRSRNYCRKVPQND